MSERGCVWSMDPSTGPQCDGVPFFRGWGAGLWGPDVHEQARFC